MLPYFIFSTAKYSCSSPYFITDIRSLSTLSRSIQHIILYKHRKPVLFNSSQFRHCCIFSGVSATRFSPEIRVPSATLPSSRSPHLVFLAPTACMGRVCRKMVSQDIMVTLITVGVMLPLHYPELVCLINKT